MPCAALTASARVSTAAVSAPLVVPGYHAALFWIPVVLCTAAALLIATLTPGQPRGPSPGRRLPAN